MNLDRDFYQQMLHTAIPIAIQNLIVSSLNTLDTVMISTLGSATIAGVGLANQVFFFLMMICFGIGTGSSVLISQYHGRRDYFNVKRTNGLATILAMFVSLIFTVVALFWPKQVIGLMIQDPQVITEGAKYLSVVALSYIITGFNFANGISLRSTGNAQSPLHASIISFVFNAFFNYVLIFGKFGFPRMGVVGAAMGTIIARLAEMAVLIYLSKRYNGPLNGKLKDMLAFDRPFFDKYMRITSPVIVNETFWALGQVLYSVAYAIVGTEATAAIQVVVAIQNIAFVLIRGLSNSCSIMLGNSIGRGEMDKIYTYALRFLKLGLMIGTIIGLFLCLTPSLTLSVFGNLEPEVNLIAHGLLRVMGIIFIFKGFNSILIVGVLRGGGDTKKSMILEMSSVWLVGVPLAFLGAAILKLPIYYVVIMAGMEEITKISLGMRRVFSKEWIHELV